MPLRIAGSAAWKTIVIPWSMPNSLIGPCRIVSRWAGSSIFVTMPSTFFAIWAIAAGVATTSAAKTATAPKKRFLLVMTDSLSVLSMRFRAGLYDLEVDGRFLAPGIAAAWRFVDCALVFVGDRALGMLEPARVLVVVARKSLAHLHDRKHPAHLERTVLAVAGHHRQRVLRQWHRHVAHLGHAARTHRHVIGRYDAADPGDEIALVHADERLHVMPHRIHGVMRLVAMDRPVARLVRDKLEDSHAADGHICRHLRNPRAFANPAAVVAGHLEHMAVHVDRMIGHREIADAHAHAIAAPHDQRIDPGKHARVPGPQVEVGHRHDLGQV